jgi:predicted phosphodiesterase
MARRKVINPSLEYTYRNALPLSYSDSSKIVIFSDFHMGNGKSRDDFSKNGPMVKEILEKYYLTNDWDLILNGDIEELQKFTLHKIREFWEPLYRVFSSFYQKNQLHKISGNHDDKLLLELSNHKRFPLYDAIRLDYHNQEFFIYHGHQSSMFYNQFNKIIEFSLHYIAKPLGIKNYSDRDNNRKKHKLEKQSYLFSQFKKTVSIIGHTHRPLFESQSIKDNLKYQIEFLLRNYRDSHIKEHKELQQKIRKLKQQLDNLSSEKMGGDANQSIYSDEIAIPCLFNSGCAIGKRGITCIELNEGKIALTYWFNNKIPQKRVDLTENSIPLEGTDYNKHIIKIDDISYISDCIELFLN